jgi:hypothetical protein
MFQKCKKYGVYEINGTKILQINDRYWKKIVKKLGNA